MKKLFSALFAISIIGLLAIGCSKEAVEAPAAGSAGTVQEATGNAQVDNVAQDIAAADQASSELDDSGLQDIDDALADLENI
ncbi:hypothetical protein J4212_08065 [Candidatus Woesearchaeota archaeon]|nr:hypothetical protein [Candidatus Woesearchaeota archaeon]